MKYPHYRRPAPFNTSIRIYEGLLRGYYSKTQYFMLAGVSRCCGVNSQAKAHLCSLAATNCTRENSVPQIRARQQRVRLLPIELKTKWCYNEQTSTGSHTSSFKISRHFCYMSFTDAVSEYHDSTCRRTVTWSLSLREQLARNRRKHRKSAQKTPNMV